MITTTLKGAGRTMTHEGTCGVTITGTRSGENVMTEIEWSDVDHETLQEMIGTLLVFLEEKIDEAFVTACFARYAQEMGKPFYKSGDDRQIGIIRGKRSKK